MTKKAIQIFFCAVVLMLLIPSVVFAAETENTDIPTEPQQEEQETEPEVLNGWVKTDGNTYYYVDGAILKGLQKINNQMYYFNGSGILETGWIAYDGHYMYADDQGVLQTGWLQVGDKKYYIGNDLYRVTGFYSIGGKKYYFNTSGVMQIGWRTINENRYYFDPSGVMATGVRKIGDYYYFFNTSGIRKTGLCKWNDRLYYFKQNGKNYTRRGWVICDDGKVRYSYGNGIIAKGVKKFDGKLYFLSTKNGIRKSKGFFSYNGATYYSLGKGVLATKWQALIVNGKYRAYYFYPSTGKQAKDTTIKHLKIPKRGYLGKAYYYGIQKLNATNWSLRRAFKNAAALSYYGHSWRTTSSEKYAIRGFTKNHGNCFVMAATFYIQAKLIGYDVRQIEGTISHIHPHSWTQVYRNGEWRVYDPDFANETGRNGYHIWYGKSGTWKYTDYLVFQD